MAGQSSSDKIVIIGAGVCGLAIAQGLKKAGIPYALHERAESKVSKRDWTFGMHWGYHALEALIPEELLARLPSTQVDPNRPAGEDGGVKLFNGATGELLSAVSSEKVYRMLRSKFRNFLLEGIDIHWNKKLADISYSSDGRYVTAHFTDGTSDTGLAIIGCDGAHSAVRTHLVGAENAKLDPIGYACAILFAKHTPEHARALRAPPLHPIFNSAIHPDGLFCWASMHTAEEVDKPEDWVFSSYISYAEPKEHVNTLDRAALLAEAKALGARFAEPVRSLYAWAPDDSAIEYTKLQNWDPRKPAHRWGSHGGRVSLAGDGAHAMTFQRGQGLNNALQDAYEYVEAVKRWWRPDGAAAAAADGLEEAREAATAAYEKEMIARGGAEVQLSAEMSELYHQHPDKVIADKGVAVGMNRVE